MPQIAHPQYPKLQIVFNERARAGAWYVPRQNQALSHIANQAYGSGTLPMVLRIDKSAWNRENLIYRKKSADCYSAKVDSKLALTQSSFAAGAWIALCQQDTPAWARGLGFDYPPIWVPGMNGEEPDALVTTPIGTVLRPVPPSDPPPKVVFIPGEPEEGDSERHRAPAKEPESGGFRWYHGLGIAAAVGGIIGVAYLARKKKK